MLKSSGEATIGNHAIELGLVEAGLELATAYPGVSGSEILPGIIEFSRRKEINVYTEWSTNEKCAFEVAYGAAVAGRKAACLMSQAGLNVAFPAVRHALEKPIQGALAIVCCDDPGLQSSQTGQDTRLLAALFRIHLFDPASPKEARDAAYHALHYSFEQKKPVILRSTHRVSHARQFMPFLKPGARKPPLDEGIKIEGGRRLGVSASTRPNRLCAGCPHRATFYAMRRASPDAVFTGGIGCSTLGISMGAVDTCIDMGGSVALASGFYESLRQDNATVPIIASVDDSIFFHASLSPLYDAVRSGKRFLLVVMDIGTKAVKGMEPTPQDGIATGGRFTPMVPIEGVLRGLGIDFVRILDPLDVPAMVQGIHDALTYLRDEADRPAVIITRQECPSKQEGKGLLRPRKKRLIKNEA